MNRQVILSMPLSFAMVLAAAIVLTRSGLRDDLAPPSASDSATEREELMDPPDDLIGAASADLE